MRTHSAYMIPCICGKILERREPHAICPDCGLQLEVADWGKPADSPKPTPRVVTRVTREANRLVFEMADPRASIQEPRPNGSGDDPIARGLKEINRLSFELSPNTSGPLQ